MTNNVSIFDALILTQNFGTSTVTGISEMTGLPPQFVLNVLSKNRDRNLITSNATGPEDLENYDNGTIYIINNNLNVVADANGKAFTINGYNSYTIHGIDAITGDDFKSLMYFFSTELKTAYPYDLLQITGWNNSFEPVNDLVLTFSGPGGQYQTDGNELFLAFMRKAFPNYIDITSGYLPSLVTLKYIKSFWEE